MITMLYRYFLFVREYSYIPRFANRIMNELKLRFIQCLISHNVVKLKHGALPAQGEMPLHGWLL